MLLQGIPQLKKGRKNRDQYPDSKNDNPHGKQGVAFRKPFDAVRHGSLSFL
jgi:hypothetical protein